MSRNVFNSVAVRKPSRNTFPMSHDFKFTGDMGELIPILAEEVLPGDVWRIRSEILVRLQPMLAPIMHNVNINLEYFFVPNRLIWDNWGDFISPPKADSTSPAHPFFNFTSAVNVGSLSDYLGIPTGISNLGSFSPFAHAGYQFIWNEFYRDQNLQDAVNYKLVNGNNNSAFNPVLNVLRKRAWRHDYFTGSLPFAQKGAPVAMPVDLEFSGYPEVYRRVSTSDTTTANWNSTSPADRSITIQNKNDLSGPVNNRLYVDINQATVNATNVGTINDLRTAMRTQEFLERQARGGSRLIEQIRMQFGVKSSDMRLDRPEFIGSTRSSVVISEVLQTSESGDTPLAEMAGHGIGVQSGRYFRYYAEEHGFIFCLLSVTPKTAYMQGVPKKFLRSDMYDYAWPVLAHIGEQEVLNKEIYVASDGQNDAIFGYVPRYSEYRYIPSRVGGEMRTSLNYWHMARIFDSRPTLSGQFIECNPTKRIFAVTDQNVDSLIMHAFHNIKCSRLLPKYGTPTL